MESADLARARGAALVEAPDVRAAMQARIHRHDYPEQRLQETIADGERLLAVCGERVGQVNGLTVVDLGDYRFGFPVRVTAHARTPARKACSTSSARSSCRARSTTRAC